MKRRWLTLISLILTLHGFPFRPAQGGGFGGGTSQVAEPLEGIKYESIPLPLSAKSAKAWIALHETMVRPLPDQTSFAEVIQALRATLGGGDGKVSDLIIYVDPTTLKDLEITMATPIASPFVGNDEVSLHTYLGFILKPLGLSHQVHDGVIVIDSPCDDCPGPVEVSAARAWTWLLLHEEVPLRFPDETPLEDVVKAIHRQTKGKGPRGRGLVIHFDLVALRAAEKDKGAPVTIEMDRVPLCTSLRLVLQQLGLKFHVRDDGVVVITSFSSDKGDSLMDVADVIDGYQLLRYVLFCEQLNRRIIVPNPEDKRPSKDDHGLPPVDGRRSRPQSDPK